MYVRKKKTPKYLLNTKAIDTKYKFAIMNKNFALPITTVLQLPILNINNM